MPISVCNSFAAVALPHVMATASNSYKVPALSSTTRISVCTFSFSTAVFTFLVLVPLFASFLNVNTFAALGAPLEAALTPTAVDGQIRLNNFTILSSENVTSNFTNHLDTIAYSVSIDAIHLPHPNKSDEEWSYDNILFFTVSSSNDFV